MGGLSLRRKFDGKNWRTTFEKDGSGSSQRMGGLSGLWERRRATAAVVPSFPI